mmetsp:Transcript_22603/g.65049  ORF Transcript_22603/g.65049 Transcript_22603/m.65049 type:complete len:878 (-) Transcript_22603:1029-3662(-)
MRSSRSGTCAAAFSASSSFVTTAMSAAFLLLTVLAGSASALTDTPNILMIPVDDLNNWIGYFNKHTAKGNQQSLTPNLDRLSAMGMSFTNAHASATICNPSRAAVWSGVRAGISGCYDNKDYPWKSFIKEKLGLNYWLQQGGYHTAARGKTYHSSQQGETNSVKIYVDEWDDYPKVHAGDVVGEYTDRMGFTEDIELSREVVDDDDPDWHTVNFCADKLHEDPSNRDNKPLFLACGIVKPHLPWVVPQKYYDRFPPDEVELPPYATTNNWKDWEERVWEDLADVPEYAIDRIANPDKEFAEVIALGKWETSIQSYLAAIAYMDMNIGRLLDAFEKSPEKDNTIIVLWSDHGYHLGEKGHHKKQTLWEEASDVPFIWVVPGMTEPGSICNKPVDLQSIYPTLMKLVGLDVPDHVDGDDIRPLLEDANADWDDVATVTVRYKNHAIVDERYRYIRYVDGSEELYDHDNDPNEFTNLYKDPNYADVKARLRARLPVVDMPTWRSPDNLMNLNVQITCNEFDVTVKRCPGTGNPHFVARDPNNNCEFLDCPEYEPEPTASPTAKPTVLDIDTDEPTASPTESPVKDPTASPTKDPTASPTAAPVTVIDTSIAELLDFGVTIDIPGALSEESDRRQLERSEVAFYLNDNLEEILSESMYDELSRAIDSSGFPFAKPSGVNLTRKNKRVTDVGDGERYQAIYGGVVTFAQTETQQFLPTKADVQDMQAAAMPRVADRVIDEAKKDLPEARISSVVTDVIMTSDAVEEVEEAAPVQPQKVGDGSSNTLNIAIGCAVGGVVLVALAAFFILRSKKKTATKEEAKDDASYHYPDEDDTDDTDDKSPAKKKGASVLAEEALKEEQVPSGPAAPEAASDVAGSTAFGR